MGGDELVVVAECPPGALSPEELAARLAAPLRAPLHYGGRLRPVRVSVGAALALPGDDARAAIARADAQMYRRKPAGGRLARVVIAP